MTERERFTAAMRDAVEELAYLRDLAEYDHRAGPAALRRAIVLLGSCAMWLGRDVGAE